MKAWTGATALVVAIGSQATGAPTGNAIEVTVNGVRSDAGRVHVDVCPERTFLNACPWSVDAPARRGTMVLTVRGVPPGRYAVQAYQDANGNGDLDRGIFGIPKEGIGFSNDAMARLRRPRFSDAAFDHAAMPQRLAVTLRYFLG